MVGLVDTLKKFSRIEINRFTNFLDSPYHNKKHLVTLLFKEIKKYYPSFTSNRLTSEELAKKIFPNKKISKSTFRNVVSDLQKLIEEFLIFEEIGMSVNDRNDLLLKALMNKRNQSAFLIQQKKAYISLERDGVEGKNFFVRSRIELCSFNNNMINRTERSRKHAERNVAIITRYVIALTCYVVTEIINSHLKVVVQESKFKMKQNTAFTLKVIEALNVPKIIILVKKLEEDSFILDLYYNLLATFQNIENKQSYLNYRDLLSKCFSKLSKDELAYHYSMMISYCVIHNPLSENKIYYDNELFNIYKIFLKQKMFINKKSSYMNEELFRNILVLGLRLKKFDWVINFIEEYSEYLHPSKKANIMNFSLAEYYYHLGSNCNSVEMLNKALNYLSEIQAELFMLKYDIKILYLMLYYDLGCYDNLFCQIKNYRQFLCRNNLVPIEKKKKLNKFINVLEKLVFLKQGDPKIEVDSLIFESDKLKNFNYQEWILNKIRSVNQK